MKDCISVFVVLCCFVGLCSCMSPSRSSSSSFLGQWAGSTLDTKEARSISLHENGVCVLSEPDHKKHTYTCKWNRSPHGIIICFEDAEFLCELLADDTLLVRQINRFDGKLWWGDRRDPMILYRAPNKNALDKK